MIFINSSPKNSFKIFQGVSPIFVPFGIGYLMAMLERNNIRTSFVDEIFEKDILKKIDDYTKINKPPFIFGFNVLTVTYKNALILSKRLKEIYPGSVIIFGGVHSTAMPDEVLSNNHVDIVVRGEAEMIITDLYLAIKNNKDLSGIFGVSYKQNGNIIHNPSNNNLIQLDDLPVFPHHFFDEKNYEHGYIMTSRGCPYNCIFCSKIYGNSKLRCNSINRVIDEISFLHSNFHIKHLIFLDDDLLYNKERAVQLCEAIKKSSFYNKMVFNFCTRGDSCDESILKTLFDTGFKGIFIGLETSSEKIMKTLKKGETLKQAIDAAILAKKIGYHVSSNFIFGLPGETHADRLNAFKLTKEIDLDLVKYNNATPFPGTELFKIAKSENNMKVKGLYENFNATATLTENPFYKIPIPYIPLGNTENQIRYDILFGTFKFYFSWKKIKRVFTKPELTNSWFDFGHSPKDFLKKLPAILLLMGLLSFKFAEMLIRYPSLKLFYYKNKNK